MTTQTKRKEHRLQALIDFTHCERGWCVNCTPTQRRKCEEAMNYKGDKK